jgi:hypothetical protein
MRVLRNVQFTRLFKIAGYLKEFNFRKSNPSLQGKISIDTSDDRGNRIMFFMEKAEEGWKILPQELPKWIPELENNLAEAIQEELPG